MIHISKYDMDYLSQHLTYYGYCFYQKKKKPISKFIIFLKLIDLASGYHQPKQSKSSYYKQNTISTVCDCKEKCNNM